MKPVCSRVVNNIEMVVIGYLGIFIFIQAIIIVALFFRLIKHNSKLSLERKASKEKQSFIQEKETHIKELLDELIVKDKAIRDLENKYLEAINRIDKEYKNKALEIKKDILPLEEVQKRIADYKNKEKEMQKQITIYESILENKVRILQNMKKTEYEINIIKMNLYEPYMADADCKHTNIYSLMADSENKIAKIKTFLKHEARESPGVMIDIIKLGENVNKIYTMPGYDDWLRYEDNRKREEKIFSDYLKVSETYHAMRNAKNSYNGDDMEWEKVNAQVKSLKKQATQCKSNKQMNEAVQCLEDAIRLSKEHGMYYYPDSIRLAKYLQLAGKSDEAWRLYNELLHQEMMENGSTANGANIYDAMALHLKREKRYSEALHTYLLCDFYRAYSAEIGEIILETDLKSEEYISARIDSLAKAVKLESDKVEKCKPIAYKMMNDQTYMGQALQDINKLYAE